MEMIANKSATHPKKIFNASVLFEKSKTGPLQYLQPKTPFCMLHPWSSRGHKVLSLEVQSSVLKVIPLVWHEKVGTIWTL